MKWATLICLFLFTFAAESRHLQKRHHADEIKGIGQLNKAVGENNFEYIVLIIISQTLQKCSTEEHQKLVTQIVNIAHHCESHEEEEKCKKSPMLLLYDQICATEGYEKGYPWIKECCDKADEEEAQCFQEHRNIEVEPYKIPDVEAVCKQAQEDPKHAYKYFLTEIARRHARLYPPTIVDLAKQYKTITIECCAADDKAKCFGERMPQIKKKTDYIEDQQIHKCRIFNTFPERSTKASTLVKICQKYPNAELKDLINLAHETADVIKDCCHKDSVTCMVDRLHLADHICEKKAKFSSKLKACCEKPIIERSSCIHLLPNDEPPENQPSLLPKFVESDHACKDYEADKDGFMAEFTCEFAKQHGHFHPLFLLRFVKTYESKMTECCAGENPPDCYKVVPNMLEMAVEKLKKAAKENCEALKTLGHADYKLVVLGRLARKLPQLADETLIETAGKMIRTAAKCCALPEEQIEYCGEEKLDLIWGNICAKEGHTKIAVNNNIQKCCAEYSLRRTCFTELEPNPDYIAPALDESAFHVDEKLCEGTVEEQEERKFKLFVAVIKLNIHCEKEKMEGIIVKFREIAHECCAAADKNACFAKEKPALVLLVKAAVSH